MFSIFSHPLLAPASSVGMAEAVEAKSGPAAALAPTPFSNTQADDTAGTARECSAARGRPAAAGGPPLPGGGGAKSSDGSAAGRPLPGGPVKITHEGLDAEWDPIQV
jgi:hypothetical protein